jgi:hypothetical protein
LKKKNSSKSPKHSPQKDEKDVKPRESFDLKIDKKVIDSLDRSSIRDRSKSPKNTENKYM